MNNKIEDIDIETAKLINKTPEFCYFSRKYNPINICVDLQDLGLTNFEAQMRMRDYHKHFYKPLIKRLEDKE